MQNHALVKSVALDPGRTARTALADDLERTGSGDIAAFIRVHQATSRKLFGIIVRILGRGDLAEEILQEVYLKVWQRAADFSAERASPITWLAAIARNRALDEGRRRQMGSLEDMPELLERPSAEDIAGDYMEREQQHRLNAGLQSLPPHRRRVLEMVYYEGLSRDAVAARIGESVGTVKAWLRNDLRLLKDHLDP